jgi:hypothetical protein
MPTPCRLPVPGMWTLELFHKNIISPPLLNVSFPLILLILVSFRFFQSVDFEEPGCARISFPIEVILRVTMTFQIQSRFLASRAMGKWYMVVGNVVKEMYFFLLQKKTGSNGVDWSIAPTLIKESSVLIKGIEVVEICLRPEPVKVANFKVGPLRIKEVSKRD